MSPNPHRLPRNAVPSRYDIELRPDLEEFVFTGREIIELEVLEPANRLTLHAIELDIRSARLDHEGLEWVGSVEYDEPMQRVAVVFDRPVPAGPARLSLEFEGVLNDQLHGFYRSSYTDVNGNEQIIATTQFEATDARRAFPCFDEPDLKAVFGITLVVPDHLMAVSNSAEISRRPVEDGKVAVTFADTIKMSTYLVAFVIGPFEASETIDVDGAPLRIIAPRGNLALTTYGLESGEFALRFLASYYGIPYPGDKVDMIAIPDFAFGAMENLGCITYRETALLVEPGAATQGELMRILDTVAHELAHMWFGDLVTMRWWDGIWLNEAFATFMEMKTTDAHRPEWKRWLAFAAIERPWAFGVDALQSSRPVEFEVGSPDEANEMFDALTYGKGSSVLRMIEQYLGEDRFRQGVGDYLRTHSYSNTVTRDLWNGLDGASGIDVGAIMDTWILQSGFPQVDVTPVDGGLRLDQRRYLLIPDETDQSTWKIPVQIRGEASGRPFEHRLLLGEPTGTVAVDGEIDWLVANAGGHGFYRVSYAEQLAEALIEHLTLLDERERFCLIDDAWAFVESGQGSAADYLALARAYREETESSIWQSVLIGLANIRHHLVSDDDLPAFRRVAADLIAPPADRLGWEPTGGESDLTRRLRGSIVGALGRLVEDDDAIERSRGLARRWLDRPKDLDPDVALASLFTLAAHGEEDDYTTVFEVYEGSDNPQTKLKILQAVSFFDRDDFVDRTLDAVRRGAIRNQDGSWVVGRLFGGRDSGTYAWQQVRKDWSELIGLMPPMTIRRLIEGIPALSRPETATDVEAFFAETPVPVAQKTVHQNVERLKGNTLLRLRESAGLSEYLRRR